MPTISRRLFQDIAAYALLRSMQRVRPSSRQAISAACTVGSQPATMVTTNSARIPAAKGARPAAGRISACSAGMFSSTRSCPSAPRRLMSDQKPIISSVSPAFSFSCNRSGPATLLPWRSPMTVSPCSLRILASSTVLPINGESGGTSASTMPMSCDGMAEKTPPSTGRISTPCWARSSSMRVALARASTSRTSPASTAIPGAGRRTSVARRPRRSIARRFTPSSRSSVPVGDRPTKPEPATTRTRKIRPSRLYFAIHSVRLGAGRRCAAGTRRSGSMRRANSM